MVSRKSVLIVDDEPIVRKTLSYLFESLGCEAYSAENGEQGLRRFRESKPSFMIIDLNMPVMDGLTLVAEIRKECSKTPLYILTGHAAGQKEYAMTLGATGFLTKPPRLATLKELTQDYTE